MDKGRAHSHKDDDGKDDRVQGGAVLGDVLASEDGVVERRNANRAEPAGQRTCESPRTQAKESSASIPSREESFLEAVDGWNEPVQDEHRRQTAEEEDADGKEDELPGCEVLVRELGPCQEVEVSESSLVGR